MMSLGKYGPLLHEKGIMVYTLNCHKGILAILSLRRIVRIIQSVRADSIQTWMYHANLIGGIAARMAGCKNVIWGIRHTDLENSKRSTQWVSWLCAKLSRTLPSAIVCCSDSAAILHKHYGYDPKKISVIYNGYDLAHFSTSPELRHQIRTELGMPADRVLLGMVGRWVTEKDHANLLQALAQLIEQRYEFTCLLVGTHMTHKNHDLKQLIDQNGLSDYIRLLGRRSDISAVMNALDLHVLSSTTEAFPNVVAEAMACGTPCVVTDVGDAAKIVGNPDWVVPPKRSDLLADAILRALASIRSEGREAIGERCRQRIAENFSIERMVQAYTDLWESLATGNSPCASSS